ncbi:alpha,alpha-trehalose phosphate synthase-like protein subunit [Hortaea werneckii]|nr:alpha,alpha-trehalose phosphate synthase-like protein subunit [Hortaea werneckii]
MATHVVSLFLPYTIAFHDELDGRPASPEAEPTPAARPPPAPTPTRNASAVDLPTRSSLLNGPEPPQTPLVTTNDKFFAKSPQDHSSNHAGTPVDPKSLLRSDADVPDWGKQAIFNQPKSRAGPLPSGSILDFAKVHDELEKKRAESRKRQSKRPSPRSRSSRAGSHDRYYEGKLWDVVPAVQGNGGMTNATRAAVDDGEIEVSWIGTLGFPTDSLSDALKEDIDDRLLNDHESQCVYVSDKDFDGHYAHYCKVILWPIFHYQVPDHPKSKAYADHSWEFYRNVNQAFADKIVESYKRGDTIWIHDYHLLLVPAMIRQKLPDAQIGFFLHTAFPSSEVFRCLATREELLRGMLGANLIAFQTQEYANHFLQTCSRLLTVETVAEGVQLDDHFVNVSCTPIGIYPQIIEQEREAPDVKDWIDIIQERYKGKHVIVGRDKLDNVRGVRQKLLAYELFLNQNPEWREKVVMIQVATSTNEQSELLTTVSDICTRIDSVHSTLAHQPLVFLKQDIGYSQYMALLSCADVLMITALRDGMNLTAHEYVYCQDGKATGGEKQHGPLILSEFTGSASVMGDAALLINPWDYKQQARAIKRALEMSEADKAHHWQRLYNIVTTRTGGHWAQELSNTLVKVTREHQQRASSAVPRLSITKVSEKYKESDRRIFILDYEGTLAPHRTSTGIPLTSPQRVLDAINELMADSKNVIYVMSGRRPEDVEATFRTLPTLGLIAENGCFLREYGDHKNEWQAFVDPDKTAGWKQDVRSILKYYEDRLEGSYIEERRASLLFRYDKCDDQENAIRFVGESADQINSACKSQHIHAVPIPKALLIEQIDFSKRTAATHIFDKLRERAVEHRGQESPDFLLVAGDDREDEVIFHWANELQRHAVIRDVFTVSVGKRNTEAHATLTQGSTGLLTALQKLGKISTEGLPMDYFNKARREVVGLQQ